MPKRHISIYHIISRINDLLYKSTQKLSKEDIVYLTSLKDSMLVLEAKSITKLKEIKKKKWHESNHVDELGTALNQTYLALQTDIVAILDTQKAALEKYYEQADYAEKKKFVDALYEIDQSIRALYTLLSIQQKNQATNVLLSGNGALLYGLFQGLSISYVANSQDTDPLFGGYLLENDTVEESEGKCAGKVITWIYQCAKEGSPRYPIYAAEGQDWHQLEQTQFKDSCSTVLDEVPILEFIKKIPEILITGKMYYISIHSDHGGHAIGIRKRHDGVVEGFDPNYGNTFALNDGKAKLAMMLTLSSYILSGYKTATLRCATAEDLDPKRSYYPDRGTLEKTVASVNTAAKERQQVVDVIFLMKKAYAALGMKANRSVDVTDNYFKTLLPLLIESFNFVEPLNQLKDYLTKSHTPAFCANITPLIQQQVAVVSSKEFADTVNAKNEMIKEYNKQQETLLQKMNELKSATHEIVKDKASQNNPQAQQKLFSLMERMRKFTGLLTRVKKAEIPAKLDAKPLTKLVTFVKKSFAGMKQWFQKSDKKITASSSSQDDPMTVLQEIGTAVAEDKEVVVFEPSNQRLVLNKTVTGLIGLLPGMMQSQEQAWRIRLEESGLSTYARLRLVAEYTLQKGALQHLLKSLKVLQHDLFTQFDGEENAKVAQFKSQLQSLIVLNEATQIRLQNGADQGLSDQLLKRIVSAISEQDINNEMKATSASPEAASMRSDRDQLLASLAKITESIERKRQKLLLSVEKEKEKSPVNFTKCHVYYCQMVAFDNHLQVLAAEKKKLLALRTFTDQSLNAFREAVGDARKKYNKLFTTNMCLHDDFEALLKKEYLTGTAVLQTDQILQCEMLHKILQDMKHKVNDKMIARAVPASPIFWSKSSAAATPTPLFYQLWQQSHQAHANAKQRALAKLNEMTDPFTMIKQLAALGYKGYLTECQNEFPGFNPRITTQSTDFNELRWMWLHFEREISSAPLRRAIQLSNYWQKLIDGEMFLPVKRGALQILTDRELAIINTIMPTLVKSFPKSLMDLEEYSEVLNWMASRFPNNILEQNTPMSLSHLFMLNVFEFIADSIYGLNEDDLKGIQISQKTHIALIKKVLSRSSKDSDKLAQLEKIEAYYLTSGLNPSFAEILNFMTAVNQIAPVYDFKLMGLCDDYQQVLEASLTQVKTLGK